MQHSETQDKLLPALLAARRIFDPIIREREAKVKTERGGEYSYTYAGLGDILNTVNPPLLASDLILTFDPTITRGEPTATQNADEATPGRIVLVALLEHATSGQWRSEQLDMKIAKSGPTMNYYQSIGSAITYGSRILTGTILGIASVDDDDTQGQEGVEGKGAAAQQMASHQTASVKQPHEKGKEAPADPRPAADVKIAPECLDSYESAMQFLDETVDVGGKKVPLFMPDEKAKLKGNLDKASRDMGKMAIEYATIMNTAAQHRASLEGK